MCLPRVGGCSDVGTALIPANSTQTNLKSFASTGLNLHAATAIPYGPLNFLLLQA